MVRLLAPAKVTLSLRIVGVRDDGYHLIDAEMVTVDLYDTVELDESGTGVVVVGQSQNVTTDHDNLVSKALAAVNRRAGATLIKRIPAGAGLGGGSTDAAAVLRWAGETDPLVAASLGADVPFCVVGGRARVSGIGEVVEPLPYVKRQLTLVTPDFGCSTPRAYSAWDELGGPVGDGHNDLEAAALVVEPRLALARDRIVDATGQRPRLAGSGSTWFLEGAWDIEGGVVVITTPSPNSQPDRATD